MTAPQTEHVTKTRKGPRETTDLGVTIPEPVVERLDGIVADE